MFISIAFIFQVLLKVLEDLPGDLDFLVLGEVENSITGVTVASELQAMIDGTEEALMVRRTDTDSATITLTGLVMIEFDMNVPPN